MIQNNYKVYLRLKRKDKHKDVEMEVTSFTNNPLAEVITFFLKNPDVDMISNTSVPYSDIEHCIVKTNNGKVVFEQYTEETKQGGNINA